MNDELGLTWTSFFHAFKKLSNMTASMVLSPSSTNLMSTVVGRSLEEHNKGIAASHVVQ